MSSTKSTVTSSLCKSKVEDDVMGSRFTKGVTYQLKEEEQESATSHPEHP